jgi:hypothetical protein
MRRERSLSEKVFGTREFFRTLSYREFVTAFSLALLLFALIAVLQYLAHYDWYTDYGAGLFVATVVTIFILNHVFYRREHKRANNFIGRNFADYLLLFTTWLIVEAVYFARTGEFDTIIPAPGEYFTYPILFILWVMIFELCLAGLKRVLIKIRCQVF